MSDVIHVSPGPDPEFDIPMHESMGGENPDGGISTSGVFPVTRNPPCQHENTPFWGDFKGGTWNTRALFAAKAKIYAEKSRKAARIMQHHDFMCFQETHAEEGRTLAFNLPDSMCAVWAKTETRDRLVLASLFKKSS